MKQDNLYLPLTPEEQDFAAENYHLINKYLNIRKLPIDEWHDVVVFRYLQSVKRWFLLPELHKYSFKTIAFYAMRSSINNEIKKRERRIKTISLNEVIPGTEEMTYADTITYDNLNYINYKGGEDMNIKYNVKLPERKAFKGGVKSDEVITIESFLTGKMKNMCFEYEENAEAKRKLASIQTYRRKQEHKELYDVYCCSAN